MTNFKNKSTITNQDMKKLNNSPNEFLAITKDTNVTNLNGYDAEQNYFVQDNTSKEYEFNDNGASPDIQIPYSGTASYKYGQRKYKKPTKLLKNLHFQRHPFHLVDPSPWPIAISFVLLILPLITAFTMHGYIKGISGIFLSLLLLTATMALWLRDVIAEGTFLGHHTSHVKKGLSIGFILFIISEAFFFLSIFWAFFHSSLSPAIDIGLSWPPYGIEAIKPFDLPLTNTILLLSSGATLTFSHHSLINKKLIDAELGLILTIILAVIFTYCQGIEYYYAPFTIADSVFGSVFFFSTGFHGVHVIVGTIMLTIALIRMYNYHFTIEHHVGFESAILYWHFVDVVWLLLYVSVYWWGS